MASRLTPAISVAPSSRTCDMATTVAVDLPGHLVVHVEAHDNGFKFSHVLLKQGEDVIVIYPEHIKAFIEAIQEEALKGVSR